MKTIFIPYKLYKRAYNKIIYIFYTVGEFHEDKNTRNDSYK